VKGAKMRNFRWLVVIGLAFVLGLINLPQVIAQEGERAGLVVQFDDGSQVTSCIDLGEQALSGYDLLLQAGLDLSVYYDANQDVAVCSINDQGCSADHCFCQFPDYWSYWHTEDGKWVYSGRGSSDYTVQSGSVEGWVWGSGEPPPLVSFEQICPSTPGQVSLADSTHSTSNANEIAAKPADMAGMLPALEAASQIPAQTASGFQSTGYLIFGFALVAMGLGLMVILIVQHR
jgi:hypothetical protein